jgi:hypothetical protein
MSWKTLCRHRAWIAVAAMALSGCADRMEPARKLIDGIEVTVAAASTEASTYAPDQLQDVRGKLDGLKASFDKKDYAAVLSEGPAVLSAAQGLANAAAAKKHESMSVLNDQWTSLAAALPGDMAAIRSRIDFLSQASNRRSNRKPAAGVDLDAATAALSETSSLWSKAQAAFATGNMEEAVTTAKNLRSKLEGLAAALGVDLSAPGASP